MASPNLRRAAPFALYGGLFVALVLVLLRFQGLLGRAEHDLVDVATAGVPVTAADLAGRTAVVRREGAPELHQHPARVEAIDPARVAARVMAVVEDVLVREGDEVAAGALLVRLDDTDAAARRAQAAAAIEGATARLTAAQLAFERAEKLNNAGNLTAQAFEGARAERDAARSQELAAQEALAEAEAAVGWHHITAPFAGRVLSRDVERGDLAQPGRVLVSLYRPDALRVVAGVPERHARAGAPLWLDFDGLGSEALPVTRTLPSSDGATGNVTVHVDLPARVGAEGLLRPGSLGRVGVEVGARSRLVVPAGAIERIGQVERAWLVREGHATAVNVRTVAAGVDLVEVLAGLTEGDTVLVR